MPRPARTRLLLAALAALLFVALLGPGAAAAAPTAKASVVAGDQAAHGSFPYLAFVYFRDGGEAEACTGTVVASNVVLTAAHCVVDGAGAPRPATVFQVVTGDVDWEGGDRELSTVSAVVVHPEYAPGGERGNWADVAVLQLSQPVSAPPVRLATEASTSGSAALIAGWGKLSPAQPGPAATAHFATTTVQPAGFCAEQADHFDPAGQLCVLDTADGAHSACSGDSGGPLLVVAPGTADEPLEIGIASFSASDSCAPSSPQYYTRADLVAPWVAAEVAALAPATASAVAAATLPRLGKRRARTLARAALAEAFGAGFERGSGYSSECEAVEASKRACAVSWHGGRIRFAGWVTVYYALEANKVVWRYSMRVKRTRARTA
jgi:secreted trypsin-like serine protease